MSFQFSVKVGIMGYYLANKEYIAKVLCINRDKPELKCDGKCQLKEQLEKQDRQEQKLPVSLKELPETALFLTSSLDLSANMIVHPLCITFPPYSFVLTDELSRSVFHPPQIV